MAKLIQNIQFSKDFDTKNQDSTKIINFSDESTEELLAMMTAPVDESLFEEKIRQPENTALMVNVKMLEDALRGKWTFALNLYTLVARDKRFSGHLTQKKLPLAAEILGKKESTIVKQANRLVEVGAFKKCVTQWMVVSSDLYAATCGRARNVRVEFPEGTDMTTLAYAAPISLQMKWKMEREAKASNNGHKRQDYSDAVEGVDRRMASSYSELYMVNTLRIRRSASTIRRQRSKAMKSGLINYERNRSVVLAGRKEVAIAFHHTEPGEGHFLTTRCGGRVVKWCMESAPVLTEHLKFATRGISKELKRKSRENFFLFSRN